MDSIKDIYFALPIILLITLIYFIVRMIGHKHKFGNKFRTIRKASRLNEIIRLLLTCWIISLSCITLVPREFWRNFWGNIIHQQNPFEYFWGISFEVNLMPKILHYVLVGNLEWLLWSAKSILPHFLLNIVLFVPFGLAAPYVFKKTSFLKVLFTGLSISFLIEFIQHFVGRESEIDDLICNTLGVVVGYLFYRLMKKLCPKLTERAMLSANMLWRQSHSTDAMEFH